MKITNVLRTLAATCALAFSAHASAAPILLVDSNGILTGANNVEVAGTLYNVTFAEGSCNSLFNGCAQSAFTFNTQISALLAAQALLDQVYVDSEIGQFDNLPEKTLGCKQIWVCFTFIPYFVSSPTELLVANSFNASNNQDRVFAYQTSPSFAPINTNTNFAIFQLASPAADVPEPTSIALFGLAMAALAFHRRRKV